MTLIVDTPQNRAIAAAAVVLRGNWPLAETVVKAIYETTAWQPIETAPKDGTPILSWDGGAFAVVVWCGCKGAWALVECAGNKPQLDPYAWEGVTHWMLILTPPQAEKAP